MLSHLSFDIQVEILKKLPIKSLIQFRSVCKSWRSLIDSSHFIAGYNDRHDLPRHLLVRYEVVNEEEKEVKYVSFVDDDDDSFPRQKFSLTVPPLIQTKAIRLIDSSHGLLCFTGYVVGTNDTCEKDIAVIWNPAIRKSIVVALPDVVHHPFSSVLGFGVCPYTKNPKLVKIKYIYNDAIKMESISSIPRQVIVFTLSSGEWTTSSSTNVPRKSIQFTYCFQTVIDRFIYRLAYDRTVAEDGGFRFHNLIMSFDLSSQEFREIDLPDTLAKQPEIEDLSIYRLRESLVVVEYDLVFGNVTWNRVCSVWMMDHGDSKAFTKLFTINIPDASVSWTLGFRKSSEPIVEMSDDFSDYDTPCALVCYEPWSEHIKDLGIRGSRCSFFASFYTESLLLLDHDDGSIVWIDE